MISSIGSGLILEVKIFTKPGCPYCAAVKEDFVKRGIRFIEVSVPGNAEALEEMLLLNGGQRRVPTIIEDNKVTIGLKGGS